MERRGPTPCGDATPTSTMSDHEGVEKPRTGQSNDILVVTQKRPYLEINFLGTYAAVCLGALSSYGGFVMPATSLEFINRDIGPSANIYWVVIAWTLCLAVGYTLVGRLSDIFGRRWFFVGASALATIGCIIGGTAKDINSLIGANVLIGLAAAAQLSFNYTLAELVPVKDRFYILALVFLIAFPFSSFGPYISRLFIVHTAAGWRWDYYLTIISNGLSTILYACFYFPPSFDELHRTDRSKWDELMDLDFGGIFLFCAGLLLFLMGLSWGGHLYPWNSAEVIATIVVGAVCCIAFVLYECYAPLKRPLIPMHLFRNRDYCVLVVVTTIGGMLYYSLNVIYPTMVATLFTTDIVQGGLLVSAIGAGVFAGQFGASILANPGGAIRWKTFFSVLACTAFTAALAGAKTQNTATALIFLSSVFIGSMESLAGVAVTIVIDDQTEIGAAAGAFGSIRSIGGVLATTIFSTILMNRVDHNMAAVPPALVDAGLPLRSVQPLLESLAAGETPGLTDIPGVSAGILAVAEGAIKEAYSNAFTLLFLVTLAFGGLSTIVAFWSPAVETRMTSDVMRRLHGERHSECDPKTTGKRSRIEKVESV